MSVGAAWEGQLVRGGQSPLATGSRATGRRVAFPYRLSLLGRAAVEGPSYYGFTDHGEMGCLSVPAVAAREGQLLEGGQSPATAGSPVSGRWVASPCRQVCWC